MHNNQDYCNQTVIKMKLDNTISYFDKPDKIDSIVRQAKKNGYFQQIKQISRCVQGMPNSFDINYKKKVHAYYKKKITKPFSLFQQPQYKRELRFYSDFNAFVRSIPDFQRIQEEPIYTMPEMSSLEREVHSETLVYNSAKKCDVSPENIQRRKMLTVFVKNAEIQNPGIFTTKINFTDSLLRGRNIPESESRIGINLNTGNRSLSKSSYGSPLSPSKRLEKVKNLVRTNQKQRSQTINLKLLKSRRSNMSIHQSKQKQKQKQSIASSQKLYINQLSALQTLNRLSMTDHKLKNFRISKPKLHQLLIKRYGNQIITQFFIVQASQDITGIVKIMRQILCASPKLMQMLVFLTMDTNKDGVITEDQLNYLNNCINVQCALTDDINKVIQYSIQNTTIKPNNADLPLQFIKQPTYKEYLRICQENKEVEAGSVRGIYRLFSFKGEKQDKNFGSNLPSIGQKTIDLNKKKIRINFETFQKIFNNEHPSFIHDLATYLLGRNYSRQQDQTPSPRKTNISNKKHEGRHRKQTLILDSTLKQRLLSFNSMHSNHSQQSNQLSRAQQILGKMHKDNKNLMTVQYD